MPTPRYSLAARVLILTLVIGMHIAGLWALKQQLHRPVAPTVMVARIVNEAATAQPTIPASSSRIAPPTIQPTDRPPKLSSALAPTPATEPVRANPAKSPDVFASTRTPRLPALHELGPDLPPAPVTTPSRSALISDDPGSRPAPPEPNRQGNAPATSAQTSAQTTAAPAQSGTSVAPRRIETGYTPMPSVVNSTANQAQTAPSPAQSANGPDRLELPSTDAQYLNNAKPPYPPLSKRLGEQGRVVVNVLIGADGFAQKAELLQSSGFERLDQSAVATALRWRYVPGRKGGVAQAMWFGVPISFVID